MTSKELLFAFLERFPSMEALAKNLYWRSNEVQAIVQRVGRASYSRTNASLASAVAKPSFRGLCTSLRECGVDRDDVLVVHSSMKSLASYGLTSEQIIESLLTDLIPDGTLVLPTFPIYRNEPTGAERITKDMADIIQLYDVQRTRSWTGELGQTLMRMPNARRSLHPLNTVAAIGKSPVFVGERFDTLDLPCGPGSTWCRMWQLNAKILMLGVDLAHSLTMIHVAEDCFEQSWPVANWYRSRKFRVRDGPQESLVTVRERHPRWAMSYAERKLSFDLYKAKIANPVAISPVGVTLLESVSLINYLRLKNASAYPYYLTSLSAL